MQIIKPKVEIIREPDTLKRIELAGRTCYKSEDRITPDSAERFFNAIVKRNHTSVLEHSNLIIYAQNNETADHLREIYNEYAGDTHKPHYIRNKLWAGDAYIGDDIYEQSSIFSSNLRAWRNLVARYRGESVFIRLFYTHPWFRDIFEAEGSRQITIRDYFESAYDDCAQAEILPWAPGKLHNIITARLTCSRGVSHEVVRHREMSFSQESTRYCKYGDIVVIEPWWYEDFNMDNYEKLRTVFLNGNITAEKFYSEYLDIGATPQLARGVLTNDTKTEVVVTGCVTAWERFLELRESAAAHPDIRIIAKLFREASGIDTFDWENKIYV